MDMNTEPKLTPWFPANVRPVRRGVYSIKAGDSPHPLHAYWNGRHWCGRTAMGAYWAARPAYISSPALGPVDGWRGLAEPPAA